MRERRPVAAGLTRLIQRVAASYYPDEDCGEALVTLA
jgi:hypothetical protein